MLEIVVPQREMYDEETNTFFDTKETVLRLEHSLVSISKWESKWRIPFLDEKNKKTSTQLIDYVKCMTLNQNVDPHVYTALTKENWHSIEEYISTDRTATIIHDSSNPNRKRRIVTSELIYYWMTAFNIPWEAQKWHISRLITLIRVAEIESNAGSKNAKMPRKQAISQQRALNAVRRKAMKTKG